MRDHSMTLVGRAMPVAMAALLLFGVGCSNKAKETAAQAESKLAQIDSLIRQGDYDAALRVADEALKLAEGLSAEDRQKYGIDLERYNQAFWNAKNGQWDSFQRLASSELARIRGLIEQSKFQEAAQAADRAINDAAARNRNVPQGKQPLDTSGLQQALTDANSGIRRQFEDASATVLAEVRADIEKKQFDRAISRAREALRTASERGYQIDQTAFQQAITDAEAGKKQEFEAGAARELQAVNELIAQGRHQEAVNKIDSLLATASSNGYALDRAPFLAAKQRAETAIRQQFEADAARELQAIRQQIAQGQYDDAISRSERILQTASQRGYSIDTAGFQAALQQARHEKEEQRQAQIRRSKRQWLYAGDTFLRQGEGGRARDAYQEAYKQARSRVGRDASGDRYLYQDAAQEAQDRMTLQPVRAATVQGKLENLYKAQEYALALQAAVDEYGSMDSSTRPGWDDWYRGSSYYDHVDQYGIVWNYGDQWWNQPTPGSRTWNMAELQSVQNDVELLSAEAATLVGELNDRQTSDGFNTMNRKWLKAKQAARQGGTPATWWNNFARDAGSGELAQARNQLSVRMGTLIGRPLDPDPPASTGPGAPQATGATSTRGGQGQPDDDEFDGLRRTQ